MRNTRQPCARSVCVTSRSRALLRANLFFQNERLPLGCVPCFGQPCQKQPSTKIASLSFGKMKSGLPKIFLFRRQPVMRCRRKNFASAISVSLFPCPRIVDINTDLFSFVRKSIKRQAHRIASSSRRLSRCFFKSLRILIRFSGVLRNSFPFPLTLIFLCPPPPSSAT